MDIIFTLYTFNAIFFAIFGLIIGSYCNVAIIRTGYRERRNSRSHCMACNHQLSSTDLVPILSYVFLGGRCRYCESRLSIQYPLVEAGTAALFVITYLVMLPETVLDLVQTCAFAIAWASLLAISVYDFRHTLVPFEFVVVLTLAALVRVLAVCLALNSYAPFTDALLGFVVLGGFFALLSFSTNGKGMGMGDALVAAPIGLLLGLSQGVLAALIATWVGAAYGLSLVAVDSLRANSKNGVTLKREMPFAPFLFVGAFIVFLLNVGIEVLVGAFTL